MGGLALGGVPLGSHEGPPPDGPLPVINGVVTLYNWPYKWVPGVISFISGVISLTLLITGKGPPREIRSILLN